ncbi:hypothetical protein G7085_03745 [Tessaracoccus sp. HDW20]|uniref:SGNH hydrolase domain-containing protein n=1 Tax=Tessaracoccus coleopterorum TaxID=2714950 RepID=UPI0018D39A6F|nr:SGNH hydrolase domain-containing protein [Tessaracoccus coleopterorum]NHB84059.1 hypothetical protein [Tessaracoccus coleopterorum]
MPTACHRDAGPRNPDHEGPGDCRSLAATQQERIDLFQPETVFWWSRYETQQRWVDGRLVGPDADEFWQVYERELASTVGRLTAGGAHLVIGLTERPGSVLVDRCTPEHCYKIHAQMLDHDEYRRRRNEIVTRLAEQDDRVRTLDMDPLLCLDPEPTVPGRPAACNDVDVDGPYRWDGTHVDIRVYGDRVAQRVLSGLLRAADR